MKEILYVQPGRAEGLINLEYKGKGVHITDGANTTQLEKIIKAECSGKGVLAFIPIADYETYQRIAKGELVVIPVERYDELLERGPPKNC